MASSHGRNRSSKSPNISRVNLPKRALEAYAFIESRPEPVKEWEQWEIDFLVEWYGKRKLIDISRALKYTKTKVKSKIAKLIQNGLIKEEFVSPYNNRKNNKYPEN